MYSYHWLRQQILLNPFITIYKSQTSHAEDTHTHGVSMSRSYLLAMSATVSEQPPSTRALNTPSRVTRVSAHSPDWGYTWRLLNVPRQSVPHIYSSVRISVQGVPKKTLVCVQRLWEALKSELKMKVGWVLKNSGNVQSNEHRNFVFSTKNV